jgi:hypothetical protein
VFLLLDAIAARLVAEAPHLSPDRAERIITRLRASIAEEGCATWASVAATARASAARHQDQAGRLLALAHLVEDVLIEAGCHAR